jgi:Sulfotransferase domain
MSGPAWLGIGAQRCGTTWFAELLVQHPRVALAADGRKEVHFFDRYLVEPWTDAAAAEYASLFDAGKCAGDFTPSYLRCLWVPPLARRACRDDVALIVLLRDPVERFASAMRWYASRPGVPSPDDRRAFLGWTRDKGNDSLWGGMYATHLAAWAREFPRERFVVLQYEAVRDDPQSAADRAWRAMGLGPHPLRTAQERSWTSTGGAAADPWLTSPGMEEQLRALYAPEVDDLVREWGIDRALWPNFA